MKYKKFITTGCSFTSGVVESINTQSAFSWPHFCCLEMDLLDNDFLNFALPGGGNAAAINNLVYYLELHPELKPEEILVGINFTGLERDDIMCDVDHPNANTDLANQHIQKELNLGWIHSPPRITKKKIVIQNCLGIIQGISYLESKSIDYFFMLLNDPVYTYSPEWFKRFLDLRTSKWVKFGGQMGMLEFVKKNNMTVSDNDWHPSTYGHRQIAKHVMEHLKKYAET